jgi:hypothetical protein
MSIYEHISEALDGADDLYRSAKLGGRDREADMWSAVKGLMEQAKNRMDSEGGAA